MFAVKAKKFRGFYIFMPQDAITLNKMAAELNVILRDAKVNKITQPAQDEIVLYLYAKFGTAKLIVSASAVAPRVGFTELERKNPLNAPAFCMLARKHLLNATITAVELLKNERIIKISFLGKNDFLEPIKKQLYCEIMGKYSNAVLCENDIILGTIKPFSLDFAKERALLCGAKYALPKSQSKAEFDNEQEAIAVLENFAGGDLAQYIFNEFKGFSLPAAKEACNRALGKYLFDSPLSADQKPNSKKLYAAINEFLNQAAPTPCVVFLSGAPLDYFFTDYLSINGQKKYFDNLCAAEQEYFDLKQSLKAKNELKTKLLSATNSALKKERKKLQTVLEKENACQGGEKYRIYGELIIANLYKIKRGDKKLEALNYYENNEPIEISLDEALSANANAQKYFKKYAKIKNTIKAIAPQKQQTLAEVDYLESVLTEIQTADKIEDLSEIELELKQSGIIKSEEKSVKIKKADLKIQFRTFEYGGFKIRAGKNNMQNDKLVLISKPADTWLHAKSYHSAHVVIESNGKHIPEDILQIAAEICAYYSEAKGGGRVEVDYTLKKYVKKPQQAKPGFVNYTDFKSVFVTPNSHSNLEV